ncbi:MAG: diguanylate cyclase [Spirochaetes bacterium]|nr:diguanylate cyclase [Spirochaetota bacterium]
MNRKAANTNDHIHELRISEERYRALFNGSRDAIIITKPDGKFVDFNQSALDLFGYTRDELVKTNVHEIYENPDDRKRFINEIKKKDYVRDFEVKLKKKDGSIMDCLFTFSIRRSCDYDIAEYQGIIRDITEKKRMEQHLIEMSFIDELTGLYNRRGFFLMADQQLKIARRMVKGLFCLFVDIDSMKIINDTYGHQAGDYALKTTANILKNTFRESDIVARYGGDEFVALIVDDMENQDIIINRINENLKLAAIGWKMDYELSLSMGITKYNPESPQSIEELIAESDARMYNQKKAK